MNMVSNLADGVNMNQQRKQDFVLQKKKQRLLEKRGEIVVKTEAITQISNHQTSYGVSKSSIICRCFNINM